jgi:hypothetical protein
MGIVAILNRVREFGRFQMDFARWSAIIFFASSGVLFLDRHYKCV